MTEASMTDFDELREHIMRSLERIEGKLDRHAGDMTVFRERLVRVETKSVFYGAVAAIIIAPIVTAIVVELLK